MAGNRTARLERIGLELENDGGFYTRYMRLKTGTFGQRRSVIGSFLYSARAININVEDRDQLRRYFDHRYEFSQSEPNKYAHEPSLLVDDAKTGDVFRCGLAPPQSPAEAELVQFLAGAKTTCAEIRAFVADGIAQLSTHNFAPTPTETTMIKITSQTLLNGKPVENHTDDELFAAIAESEREIAKLNDIKAKPKKLQAKIAEMEAGIAALVAYLDTKTPA